MIEQHAITPHPMTKYVSILHTALRDLHGAYPDQQITLRIQEVESNGWQCYIELREHDIKMASESFYINPPDARQP